MATNQQINFSDIGALEKMTGLGPQAPLHYDVFKLGDNNQYGAHLAILAYGTDSLGGICSAYSGVTPYAISVPNYNSFISSLKARNLVSKLSYTPAGQKGQLEDLGSLGIFSRTSPQMPFNPMTGPGINMPCLGADLLNSIHPGMVDSIESVCNIIRTKAYFSLPVSAMGGLQSLMYKVEGAINSFMAALYDIYYGAILAVQQFMMVVNGIMASIGNMIYSFINSIIPLDLICAILGAAQSILDDVAFFASLFNGSDGLFNAINAVQTVINYGVEGLNYAYNPLSLINLIPGVSDIFSQLNTLESNPEAFLGTLVAHFGASFGTNNQSLQVANAIIAHYGLQAQLGPLGPIMASAGTAGPNTSWYRTGNPGTGNFGNMGINQIIPNMSFSNPDTGALLDINCNPYVGKFQSDISGFVASVGSLATP